MDKLTVMLPPLVLFWVNMLFFLRSPDSFFFFLWLCQILVVARGIFQMRHAGSSSLTGDRILAPCTGSAVWTPGRLHHQGSLKDTKSLWLMLELSVRTKPFSSAKLKTSATASLPFLPSPPPRPSSPWLSPALYAEISTQGSWLKCEIKYFHHLFRDLCQISRLLTHAKCKYTLKTTCRGTSAYLIRLGRSEVHSSERRLARGPGVAALLWPQNRNDSLAGIHLLKNKLLNLLFTGRKFDRANSGFP